MSAANSTDEFRFQITNRKGETFDCVVDAADRAIVESRKWQVVKGKRTNYLRAGKVWLHRLILNPSRGMISDHKNRNGLDNRRDNLREATPSQNCANRAPYGKMSIYKGVSQIDLEGWIRWSCTVNHNGKQVHQSYHHSEEEAARLYDAIVTDLQGDFAYLNFPLTPRADSGTQLPKLPKEMPSPAVTGASIRANQPNDANDVGSFNPLVVGSNPTASTVKADGIPQSGAASSDSLGTSFTQGRGSVMDIAILRFHKSTRQWYVWLGKEKRRLYFGSDPTAAKQKYAQWLASNGGPPALPPPSAMTVADAVEAYRRFAVERYTDRRELHRITAALNAVVELYGRQPAPTFRAKALRDVRVRMLSSGKRLRSRKYVNKLTRAIQTAWRWLANEEIVPAESAASVCMVRALGPGEGGKERLPILPPADGAIEATLAKCPKTVAAMVQVQRLAGMRPGEVRRMRWEEISRDPSQPVPLAGTGRTIAAIRCGETVVWIYAPGSHKTLRRGKSRAIPLGPMVQAILTPKDSGSVFLTRLGTQYRADSYARAVERAAKAAGVARWSPLQLRHLAATEFAEQFDDHTAASVLGHAAGSTASKVYVEQSIRKAAEAAAKCG